MSAPRKIHRLEWRRAEERLRAITSPDASISELRMLGVILAAMADDLMASGDYDGHALLRVIHDLLSYLRDGQRRPLHPVALSEAREGRAEAMVVAQEAVERVEAATRRAEAAENRLRVSEARAAAAERRAIEAEAAELALRFG